MSWNSSILKGSVQDGWIDSNGHMNIVYYIHILDQGTTLLVSRLKESLRESKDRNLRVVIRKLSIHFRKELKRGEQWWLRMEIQNVLRDRAHLRMQILSTESIHAVTNIEIVFIDELGSHLVIGDVLTKQHIDELIFETCVEGV